MYFIYRFLINIIFILSPIIIIVRLLKKKEDIKTIDEFEKHVEEVNKNAIAERSGESV